MLNLARMIYMIHDSNEKNENREPSAERGRFRSSVRRGGFVGNLGFGASDTPGAR